MCIFLYKGVFLVSHFINLYQEEILWIFLLLIIFIVMTALVVIMQELLFFYRLHKVKVCVKKHNNNEGVKKWL